jgi:hypothetical protein
MNGNSMMKVFPTEDFQMNNNQNQSFSTAGELSAFSSTRESSSKNPKIILPPKSLSSSIELLINYLTLYLEDQSFESRRLKKFEELTAELLENNHDPELHRITKAHGWNGCRFRATIEKSLDVHSCLQALSNWYLRHNKFQNYASQISNLIGLGEEGADQILSFCPDNLLNFLRDNPRILQNKDAPCFTFNGACMLADISGFSKFSAAMCSKGVLGLDELREATSVFLGHIVKVVYEFDGDGKLLLVYVKYIFL